MPALRCYFYKYTGDKFLMPITFCHYTLHIKAPTGSHVRESKPLLYTVRLKNVTQWKKVQS